MKDFRSILLNTQTVMAISRKKLEKFCMKVLCYLHVLSFMLFLSTTDVVVTQIESFCDPNYIVCVYFVSRICDTMAALPTGNATHLLITFCFIFVEHYHASNKLMIIACSVQQIVFLLTHFIHFLSIDLRHVNSKAQRQSLNYNYSIHCLYSSLICSYLLESVMYNFEYNNVIPNTIILYIIYILHGMTCICMVLTLMFNINQIRLIAVSLSLLFTFFLYPSSYQIAVSDISICLLLVSSNILYGEH